MSADVKVHMSLLIFTERKGHGGWFQRPWRNLRASLDLLDQKTKHE
jgi:hypothetical protein